MMLLFSICLINNEIILPWIINKGGCANVFFMRSRLCHLYLCGHLISLAIIRANSKSDPVFKIRIGFFISARPEIPPFGIAFFAFAAYRYRVFPALPKMPKQFLIPS